jgi:hypothetical protein
MTVASTDHYAAYLIDIKKKFFNGSGPDIRSQIIRQAKKHDFRVRCFFSQFLEHIFLETAKHLKNLVRAKKRLYNDNVGMFSLSLRFEVWRIEKLYFTDWRSHQLSCKLTLVWAHIYSWACSRRGWELSCDLENVYGWTTEYMQTNKVFKRAVLFAHQIMGVFVYDDYYCNSVLTSATECDSLYRYLSHNWESMSKK